MASRLLRKFRIFKNESTQNVFIWSLDNFRARNVTFELKDGTKRTIFVNEIEDEDDDQFEMIFMADDPKDDVFISQVVDAIPGSANFSLDIHQMPFCELTFVLKGQKGEFKLKDGAIKTFW